MTKDATELLISVPPFLDAHVTYGTTKQIPVQITNNHPIPIIIDTVILHAQPEWEAAAAAVATTHRTPEFRIDPGAIVDRDIPFHASTLCRAATNYLDVIIEYRDMGAEQSPARALAGPHVCYLIIDEPPLRRQQIFISYKEPEDLSLAEQLGVIVRRNGFRFYIARADVRPGSHIWRTKIIPQIKRSKAMAALCTRLTPLGSGVEREIKIALKEKKTLVPLIERDAPILDILQRQKNIERTIFDRATAPLEFAKTIEALRTKRK